MNKRYTRLFWAAGLAVLLTGLGPFVQHVVVAEAEPVAEAAQPPERVQPPAEPGAPDLPAVPDTPRADGESLFAAIKEKADSTFEPGKRSGPDAAKVTAVATKAMTEGQQQWQDVWRYNRTINMYREILLSIGLLLFGAVTLGIECYLIRRDPKHWSGQAILRMIIITLIIISGSFLITSGYSNDQIVPIVGLLGSIAGYLLGKGDTQPTPPQGGTGNAGGAP